MALASRGLRDLGDGPEAMEAQEAAAVRAQARSIQRRSLAFGLLVAAAAWLVG